MKYMALQAKPFNMNIIVLALIIPYGSLCYEEPQNWDGDLYKAFLVTDFNTSSNFWLF